MGLSIIAFQSPIHLEYLHNMGVQGTFTLAIIVNQQLWGLFAHHHYSERFLSYEVRQTCEVLSLIFTQRLLQISQTQYQQRSETYREREEQLLEDFSADDIWQLKEKLFDARPSLLDLCSAGGLALILGEHIFLKGLTPKETEVRTLRDWLRDHRKMVYHTRALTRDLNLPEDFAPGIAGLLSACISEEPNLFAIWFRPSVDQTVSWGGNPAEAVVIEKRENARGVRLSPRKSFSKWKEEVKQQALPWAEYEIEMAFRVREKLIRTELRRAGQTIKSLNNRLSLILNRELEQLVYIASHDLQEPLRTITNYVQLLEEEGQAVLTDDLRFYLERIVISTNRMKTLVKDLLDYSRLGRSLDVQAVDLNAVVREVLEDLEPLLRESQGTVELAPLPTLHGNPTELKRLFQNLISNALKYHVADRPPQVAISAVPVGMHWRFAVRDNGIGIEEKNLDKIFQLFQRLHSKKDYEGTGIGLAQVKKIVEAYQGDIEAESTPGEGTTFYFTLTDK